MSFLSLIKLKELSSFQKSKFFFIAFFLILSRLPTLFTKPFDVFAGASIILIWSILIYANLNFISIEKLVKYKRKIILGIYFLVPILYSFLYYKVSFFEVFTKVGYIMIGGTFFLMLTKHNKEGLLFLIKIINFSIVLYILINIGLVYFTGFRNLGGNLLLSYFNIDFPRISYPLNKSVGQIGFLFVAAFVIEVFSIKKRWYNYVIFVAICLGIICLDSRNVYLTLFYLTIGYIFIIKSRLRNRYNLFAIFTGILVVTFPFLSVWADFFRDISLVSARNAFNRFEIWNMAIYEFRSSNLKNILIGHGYEGYYFNGLSDKTIEILNMNIKKATVHNSLINNLYEVGVIGIGIIVSILIRLFQVIGQLIAKTKFDKELLSIYLIVIGLLFYGNLVSISIYTSVEIIIFIMWLMIWVSMVKCSNDTGKDYY